MRRAVETVGPDATALEAAERLHDHDVGSVVVVDGGVVGIVTESDIVSLVATGGDPASAAVEAVMSAPVHTVKADETVVAAARALRERGIKRYLGPVDIGDGDTVVDGEAIVLAEPNPQAVRSIDASTSHAPLTG